MPFTPGARFASRSNPARVVELVSETNHTNGSRLSTRAWLVRDVATKETSRIQEHTLNRRWRPTSAPKEPTNGR